MAHEYNNSIGSRAIKTVAVGITMLSLVPMLYAAYVPHSEKNYTKAAAKVCGGLVASVALAAAGTKIMGRRQF
jgi:hypothetical protein